jgi:transposase
MSMKRLVKRLLNFKGVVIDSVEIREVNGAESVVVSVHLTKAFALRDPSTGKREPKYDSPPQVRRWRHLDFADIPVYVEMECRRVKCGDGTVKAEAVPFARQSSRFTAAFEDQVSWMAKHLP